MSIERGERRRGPGFLLAAALSVIIAVIVVLIGGYLAWRGYGLATIGGSWYYVLAGAGLVVGGLLMALRRPVGGLVFAVTLWATLAWAIWEAGLAFWPLLPRLAGPAVIGVLVLLALLSLRRGPLKGVALLATGLGTLATLGVLGVALAGTYSAGQADDPVAAGPEPKLDHGEWRYYGRDPGGQRFAPVSQITKANVGDLKEAWRIRTGDIADRGSEDQTTPSLVGDTLYVCTPTNIVIALDPETGQEKWRHDPKVQRGFWNRCRGVGVWERPAPPPNSTAPTQICDRRIISTTIDARMFALDAATGQRCPGFGENGEISLREGMGEIKRGFYFPTSAPTVAGDLVIVGGWVQDNSELNEPSGVVRAFSAIDGELVWAWDMGDPTITKLPPAGKTYTRGTPNVWSTPAFDPALGLVYLPVGNATPDYWGSHRTDIADQYASSVVALDIATGRERWKFQTVHHDVWDYDVPAQPMLLDFPDGNGGTIPALIQLTKRGQVFVLDRRTGAPITEVVEKPTPQDAAPGEWVTPTQPYSVGMPTVGADPLTERQMWGVTMLDQIECRIAFRKVRYKGDFTPPHTVPTLQFPGNGGGQNWNSGAYDPVRGLLIMPGLRNPITVTLTKTNRPGMNLALAPNRSAKGANAIPYQTKTEQFMSPVRGPKWLGKEEEAPQGQAARPAATPSPKGEAQAQREEGTPIEVPCLAPPHGQLTAIDLKTRQIAWQVPIGTAERSGPFGWKSGLKIPVGTFGLGGVMVTGSGLAFHGATQDYYLRAYDTASGKVIWQSPLPVGAGGTPMSFISPRSGRQFVVLTAGGARRMEERGDYVIAYALPEGTPRQ